MQHDINGSLCLDDFRRLLDEAMEGQRAELRSQNEVLVQRVLDALRSRDVSFPVLESQSIVMPEDGPLPSERPVSSHHPATSKNGASTTMSEHLGDSGKEGLEDRKSGELVGHEACGPHGALSDHHATAMVGALVTSNEHSGDSGKEALDKHEGRDANFAQSEGMWRRTSISSVVELSNDFVSRLIQNDLCTRMVGVLIMTDALVTTVDAHRRAINPGSCEKWLLDLGTCFNMAFLFELILRIWVHKKSFFTNQKELRWNIADIIIIISGIIEEAISWASGRCGKSEGDTALRNMSRAGSLLRILRIVRVVRLIKFSAFREFRIMVQSVLNCVGPLAWACLLLLYVMWAFGIYFVFLSTEHVNIAISEQGRAAALVTEEVQQLRESYGSVFAVIYTLFSCITGGTEWRGPADVLFSVTGRYDAICLWMLFNALVGLAVLNIITGIFVDAATQMAMQDRDLQVQETMRGKEQLEKVAKQLFMEADEDGSGLMSKEELKRFLREPAVSAYMSSLGLDIADGDRLFELMDLDEDGKISIDEFVSGCQNYHGGAMKIDMTLISLQIKSLTAVIKNSFSALPEDLGHRFVL